MKIQRIYVTGYRGDVRFTRCCVASIRCWYPDIPIILVKDLNAGDYDTSDIQRRWGVEIYQSSRRRFGVAGKIELLLAPPGERFLAIDSDIVLLGPVLEVLDAFDEDFLVNGWEGSEDLAGYFYDIERLKILRPDFLSDQRAFNAGQFVASSGLLRREDFAGLLEFTEPPRLLRPDIFKNLDQGPLNYVVLSKYQQRELTVRWHNYMWWAGGPGLAVDMARLRGQGTDPAEGYPMLLHWAGFRPQPWRRLPHAAVLAHFERLYYAGIPHGRSRRLLRHVGRAVRSRLSRLFKG